MKRSVLLETTLFHPLLKTKIGKMVLFWTTLYISFFPWMCTGRGRRRFSPLQRLSPSLSQNPKQTDKVHTPPRAQAGEEGDFLPYNASLPLSPKTPNKATRLTPHLVPCHWGKKKKKRTTLWATLGRLPSGCLDTLPLWHDWTRVVALSPAPLINTRGKGEGWWDKFWWIFRGLKRKKRENK